MMTAKQPDRRDSGYLLPEVMLTLATVFMATLVLFGALLTLQVQSTASKHKQEVLGDVKSLTEQMMAQPISGLGTLFPHNTVIPEFNDLHAPSQQVKIVYADGDPDAVPLEYRVEATWKTAGGRPARLVVHGMRVR
jgi:hypothetical protein